MKILITGVNGFVGLNIVDMIFLMGKHQLIGTDLTATHIGNNNIEYIKSDIGSNTFIQDILKKVDECDVIIHVAASLDKDPLSENVIRINCNGAQKILEIALKMKCKRIIYISGVTVIGKPIITPITEEHLTYPENTYQATKLFGEHMILMADKFNVKSTVLRVSAPIGYNMPNNRFLKTVIMNCIKNLDILVYGKGMRRQNYVDVRDVGSIICKLLESEDTGIFNIGGNRSYTNLDVIKLCKQLTNSSSNIIFNDVTDPEESYDWELSINKARKVLGYNPQYELKDSIVDIKNYIMDK